ncbi:MAG: hypothetical protein C0501_14080 [Isosphaera sp.]|nr:hypothetical protein [Isosphaera sp.]
MCTLTAVPAAGGVRVAFNRDEARTRPAAAPPAVVRAGARAAVYPTDPASGGTWLAATDAGLVLAVLNGNPPGASRVGTVSRGTIIPALLATGSPGDAVSAAEQELELEAFAPFRLVAVGREVIASLVWDGRTAEIDSRLLGGAPAVFTSSGLGDHLVTGPRTGLFRALTAGPPAGWPAAQDAFHRHRWPDRPEVSVNMSRATARTVSHAVVEVGPAGVRFAYHADAPDAPAADTVCELPLAAEVRP